MSGFRETGAYRTGKADGLQARRETTQELAACADLLIGEIERLSTEMDRLQRVFWRHFRRQSNRAQKAETGLRVLAGAVRSARLRARKAEDVAARLEDDLRRVIRENLEQCKRAYTLSSQWFAMRDALRFYADPATYKNRGHHQMDDDTQPIRSDRGNLAREALAKVGDHFPDVAKMVPEQADQGQPKKDGR